MRNDWLHVDSRTFTLIRLKEQFISLILGVLCEIEADQETNSRASGGLRTWFIGVVFDTVDEIWVVSDHMEWKRVSFGLEVSALVSSQVLDRRKRRPLPNDDPLESSDDRLRRPFKLRRRSSRSPSSAATLSISPSSAATLSISSIDLDLFNCSLPFLISSPAVSRHLRGSISSPSTVSHLVTCRISSPKRLDLISIFSIVIFVCLKMMNNDEECLPSGVGGPNGGQSSTSASQYLLAFVWTEEREIEMQKREFAKSGGQSGGSSAPAPKRGRPFCIQSLSMSPLERADL
ncbi:hypothetical protein F2Q69_00008761 [Brassica cretica]|uniref:Uncharacterized protein n=1 Tax=Brassica cretica TaxID=69181 RepID=A0A8S9NUT2_BRACR|nr:hypothetical protein F2Q69_00008761 [Brassica cretica]